MLEVSGGDTPKEANLASDTEVEELNGHMEALSPQVPAPRFSEGTYITEDDKKLASQLVAAFMKRQEYRGSDVRLDVGTIYRPDSFPRATVNPHRWEWHEAHAYRFLEEAHINCLELRALINTIEWRCRRSAFGDVRFLHLSDSQVVLAVAVKGRSSSRQLNRLLKKLGALQVVAGAFPIYAWVETHLNPADKPSRKYAPKKKWNIARKDPARTKAGEKNNREIVRASDSRKYQDKVWRKLCQIFEVSQIITKF